MAGNDKERRIVTAGEFRVEAPADGGPRRIEGYAAVFGVLSTDLGGFREVIEPGAFAETITRDDIRALVNHDSAKVIGRNRAGTLALFEDDHGLGFVIDPPDTAAGRDLLVSLDRGDVDQMSFLFEAMADRWASDSAGPVRHLEKARLFEVSVVTFPAYPQTSAAARSRAADLATGDGAGDESGESGKLQGRRRRNRARLDLAIRKP